LGQCAIFKAHATALETVLDGLPHPRGIGEQRIKFRKFVLPQQALSVGPRSKL
jgi:hypothetical protein